MGAHVESRLAEIGAVTAATRPPGGNGLIGAASEEIRTRLLRLTTKLDQHLADHALPLLRQARAQLENHACRIAVVGQVKAGKTTLINALINSPNLLPTDINPWTAVVTSLHFRNGAHPPEQAAAFHLFSLDEWRSLAEGGGRLRELTQRLMPEFRPELLRAQLEVMHQRARRRLGPSMQSLLGQCHRYREITPQLLSDYVSAGDDYGEGAVSEDRRKYSDITRSAELFFNSGPFAFPVTLIDTPGTNDPFLVRDEVTRRSLENPEVYIFAMSALQPLLPADIAMLRLLNGLHKDRIVVFINRVDQLPNPVSDGATVKADVEHRLRLEFPTLHIPVIVGSAWLGLFCQGDQSSNLPAHLTSALAAALRDAGLKQVGEEGFLSDLERSHLAPILQSISGMDAMAATLTRLVGVSSSSVLMQQIANCYFELVRYAEISAKAEQRSAEVPPDAVEPPPPDSQFLKKAESLRGSFRQIEATLSELVAARTGILDTELRNVVNAFADEEAAAVQEAMQHAHREKVWVCDVARLREALEGVYVQSFDQAVASLKAVERGLYPHLEAVVTSLLPDYQGEPIEAPAEPMRLYPSAASLADFVTMDLGQSWWKLWFAARPDPQERADHLRTLIEDDFIVVAGKLVQEAESQLRRRVDHTMRKMQAVGDSLLAATGRQAPSARHDRFAGDQADAGAQAREERRNACATRVAALAAIGKELRDVLKRLELMAAESSAA